MRLPWIFRSSHEEMMALVSAQLVELKAERVVLLDRLGSLGLGGPLFTPAVGAGEETDHDAAPRDADDLEQLMMQWRRRPSRLADALTHKARREQARGATGPSFKWIPQADAVTAALDAAEASGKIQA